MQKKLINKLTDFIPLKPHKILLIGETCEDVYHFGRTSRLSPEGPVPVFLPEKTVTKKGMAANVLDNLSSLGQHVEFVTNDNLIRKERFVDSRFNAHVLRVDRNDKVEPIDFKDLNFDLEDFDSVVISDYNKGFITSNFCREITTKFKGHVFVDTKKSDLSCFKNCVLKINEEESKKIKNLSQGCDLITTLGKFGASYKEKVFPGFKSDVFDVCGAGDVFLASLTSCFLSTKNMPMSIMFANLCSSISVKYMGNHCIEYEEINEEIKSIFQDGNFK